MAQAVLLDEVLDAAVVDAQRQYAEGGFIGMTLEQDKGGLGLPVCAAALANLPFSVANTGLMSYHGVTNGSITLLAAHGSPEQQATWLPKLTSGEAYGTMCLSESHAGSSLTDLRTTAVASGDGASYKIKGNKMWITGGDHGLSENICHFVLAKLPGAPPGVKGISLFLVPKVLDDGTRNDVYLGGMNHKMGQIASVNAGELLFGDRTGGATGFLVGEEHEGLKCMFVMMNELRVATGMGASVLQSRTSDQHVDDQLAWRRGLLVFDQITLADAAVEFNRYNQTQLKVLDSQTAAIRIGGSFEATNVEAFVRLLQSAYGLKIDRDDETVKISE